MIKFRATIHKFDKKGEKTGWTYAVIPETAAHKIKPDTKVSFRVKGTLDGHAISAKALIPMGEGEFILPLKNELRKILGKGKGDVIVCELELDEKALAISADLLKCLKPEPAALANFKALPRSHQHYYSNWIEGAKTIGTKSKRITMTVMAMASKQTFAEMLRAYRDNKFI